MKTLYIYIYIYIMHFINHVIAFIFSMEWLLKLYSIRKFKYFSFQINLYFLEENLYLCTLLKKFKFKP